MKPHERLYKLEQYLMYRLRLAGWFCYRIARYDRVRPVDIIAIMPLDDKIYIRFIQVKYTKIVKEYNEPLRLLKESEKEELTKLCEEFKDFDNVSVELAVKLKGSVKIKFVDLKKELLL